MRVVLMLFLLIAPALAWAEWVKQVETDDIVAYIDPTTLRTNGSFQTIWKLQDLKKRSPSGAMSRRLQEEYDCKGERNRTLSVTAYSEPMGVGRTIVTVGSPAEWESKTLGMIRLTTNGIVCASGAAASNDSSRAAAPARAEPVQISQAEDNRTERREIRPGCAVMVVPGDRFHLRHVGGTCVNGLVEGIVKLDFEPNAVALVRYQGGKSVGAPLRIAIDSKGDFLFSVLTLNERGSVVGMEICRGNNANERSNNGLICREADRNFGVGAFDSAAVSGDRFRAPVPAPAANAVAPSPPPPGGPDYQPVRRPAAAAVGSPSAEPGSPDFQPHR